MKPEIGSTIPFATRYDVNAQVASSYDADTDPAMCGRLTFTMVVSRISMNAAEVTTTAISQGLARGFQAASDASVPLTSASRHSLQRHSRHDGKPERQRL